MSVIKIPYGSVKEPDIEMTAVGTQGQKSTSMFHRQDIFDSL